MVECGGECGGNGVVDSVGKVEYGGEGGVWRGRLNGVWCDGVEGKVEGEWRGRLDGVWSDGVEGRWRGGVWRGRWSV